MTKWRIFCGGFGLVLMVLLIGCTQETTTVKIGIFSQSVWNVPNWRSYDFFDSAIKRYSETHPSIEIEYRSGTLKEDYSEWISQKILTGEEPDLFLILPEDFVSFSSIGVLEDLDSYMEGDPSFDGNLYYANALRSGRYQDSQYALAIEVVPTLLFANQSILEEHDIELPSTTWEWSDLGRIVEQLSGYPEIQAIQGFDWKLAAYTNGQQLFSDKGDKALFTSEGMQEAMTFAAQLKNWNRDSYEFEDGRVAFAALPFSEYKAYAYFPYSIQKYENFSWQALLLPKGPRGRNGGDLKSLLMGMSSRSNNKKEAWEFLEYLITDIETQKSILVYSHGVPVRKDIIELDEANQFMNRGRSSDVPLLTPEQIRLTIENSLVFPQFSKFQDAIDRVDFSLKEIEVHPSRLRHQLYTLNFELNSFLSH